MPVQLLKFLRYVALIKYNWFLVINKLIVIICDENLYTLSAQGITITALNREVTHKWKRNEQF